MSMFAKKWDLPTIKPKQQQILGNISKIAKEELRETDQSKQECLRQFRIWIEQNQDIKNCLLDDNFLLRFLRVKKYSLLMAQQTLLKYLNYRQRFPDIFQPYLTGDIKLEQLMRSGYIVVSPNRDSHGRRVIIYNVSKFNSKTYSGTDMARMHAITYETLLTEEENQILGVTHVADIAGINASFLTLFSVTDFGYLIKWGEQSFPMRHKSIHILNMPTAVRYIYDFAKSNMSSKLNQRCLIHDTTNSLFKTVDKTCLPKEMGGCQLTTDEMITQWLMEVEKKQDRLVRIDQIALLSDQGIITSKKSNVEMMASFRKLDFD